MFSFQSRDYRLVMSVKALRVSEQRVDQYLEPAAVSAYKN